MQKLTRKQAIREKCLDCCAGFKSEIKKCNVTQCPLWVFRNGREEGARKKDKNNAPDPKQELEAEAPET